MRIVLRINLGPCYEDAENDKNTVWIGTEIFVCDGNEDLVGIIKMLIQMDTDNNLSPLVKIATKSNEIAHNQQIDAQNHNHQKPNEEVVPNVQFTFKNTKAKQ